MADIPGLTGLLPLATIIICRPNWYRNSAGFGNDRITLTLAGREDGDTAEFEGTALQVPGVAFRAALSRISD
jgi:hypothetical protein